MGRHRRRARRPYLPVQPISGKLGTPIALFNGKDLTGWTWHTAAANSKIGDVWSVKDGALHCAAAPTGFISTDKEYKDFVLTVEQRHITKLNGGVFVCITGEEKVWPNAIQIQGKFANVGDLINQNKGMKSMTTDPARTTDTGKDLVTKKIHENVEKPAGEWNTLVIAMENGNLSVTLNGQLQNMATNISPDAGKIGIQAEGAEMEFRKVELTPIE